MSQGLWKDCVKITQAASLVTLGCSSYIGRTIHFSDKQPSKGRISHFGHGWADLESRKRIHLYMARKKRVKFAKTAHIRL